ncbi:hypothetical protein SNE40_013781 [Patella caerulea]|uniref:Uncharacterized protein n=1 Tax=Patella caerulea TaxID=87958 RepID=A0AAN8PHR4_PATCE
MGVDSLEVHPDAQKPPATETLEHCTSPSMPNPTRFLKRPIVTDVCLSPTERICNEFVDIGLTLPLSGNLDEASKLPVASKGKIVTHACLSPTERICTDFVDIGLALPTPGNLDEASKLPGT